MIIVTDVDCTLNNLMQATLDIYNETYNTHYTLSGITKYCLNDCFEERTASKLQKILNSEHIWDYVLPLHNAALYLNNLYSQGHEIYFATDNNPDTYGRKVRWIMKYFPWADKAHIICIKHKWLLKADVLIEDFADNLIEAKDCCKILMDYPWNHDVRHDVHRCGNWDQVYKVITDKIRGD